MLIENGKELALSSEVERVFREGEEALGRVAKRCAGGSWFKIERSWLPEFKDGDTVLVEDILVPPGEFIGDWEMELVSELISSISGGFSGDGVYAFEFDGEPYVARIFSTGRVDLVQLWVEEKTACDDRPYPFRGQRFLTVPLTEVKIVGRVVCSARSM
ncbi:MAG: hypothetical protein FDZ69_11070 [Deltaproteobacteria bacterium]|nr:MAG: hypothetical protein FDZ69_11070 [Deltaproteobacteria bacterium]